MHLIRLGQVVRVGLTASAFLAFFVGALVLAWGVLPLVALCNRDPRQRRRACQRVVRRGLVFFHDYMRVMRLVRFDPRVVPAATVRRPCILVANHPTLVDATAILAAFEETVCVVKTSHFNNPGIHRLLRTCGFIDNRASDGLAGGAVIPEALERLSNGMTVLIFPESSRSTGGRILRRFKRGAFEIAARAQVPLVPIFLYCDPPILSKEVPWHYAPREVPVLSFELLPAIDPRDWQGDSRAMAAHVRQLFQDRIDARERMHL